MNQVKQHFLVVFLRNKSIILRIAIITILSVKRTDVRITYVSKFSGFIRRLVEDGHMTAANIQNAIDAARKAKQRYCCSSH